VGENNLQAESRADTGKGVARKLRAAGKIPGIIYGAKSENRPISVDPRSLEQVLHASGSGMNTLIDLAVDGSDSVVLVKELQRDPIRGAYLHADFYEVDLSKPIEVMVPIHFLGRARGVEFGGIVDHPVRELDILCLPHAIPDSVEADISELEIGDSLHVRDLVVPDGVTVLSDPELSIANVETPAVEEEPVAAEVEEGDAEAATEEGDAPATEEGEAKDSEG
jgi:large subunit ribosomal protein L25